MNPQVRRILAWLGRIGVTFLALLAGYIVFRLLAPAALFTTLTGLGALITGM